MNPNSNPSHQEPLPPIPSPAGHQWREFRIRFLPGLIFCVLLGGSGYIWKNRISPPNLVGEVETSVAKVSSPIAGALSHLKVTRFQHVTAGEPLAQIQGTDPKVLAAELAVMRAEAELLRADMSPVLNQQKLALDTEKFRLSWMIQRTELATDKIKLQEAELELNRTLQLRTANIGAEANLDQARAMRDRIKVEVQEKEKLVAEIELGLQKIKTVLSSEKGSSTPDPMAAALNIYEEKLHLAEAQMSPIILKAPMDGVVSVIYRRNGENVSAGEPILSITGSHSDRILGFVRQPLNLSPREGMTVEVRSRGGVRASGIGTILNVGAQLEPVSTGSIITAAADKKMEQKSELGLPVFISVPPELKLVPGEAVDLRLLQVE